MTFPDQDTMYALAALAGASEFCAFELEGVLAAKVGTHWVKVSDAALANLVVCGWVSLGEEDSDTNMPASVDVTEQGRYALGRYLKSQKKTIVFMSERLI